MYWKVWRKGSYLFWACPYWLLVCIGAGVRIFTSLPVWRTQHPVSTQLLITCAKMLLSSVLLLVDGVTFFWVSFNKRSAISVRIARNFC